MSDYSELWERFERYGAERFETFTDWANGAELPGRLGPYYAERAPGSWWELVFRTFKAMKARGVGYMGQTLAFPEVATLAELFELARYIPNPPGGLYQSERDTFTREKAGAAGFLFVSGRNDGAGATAPCGHVGGTRDWSPPPISCRRLGGGSVFHSTYAKPRALVLKAWGTYDGDDAEGFALSSFELVTHDTGRTLVIGRSRYGSRWLAYVDAGETMESLMPQGDRDVIERGRFAERAAWGGHATKPEGWRTWAVNGIDRTPGALGRGLPFEIEVGAIDHAAAQQAAIDTRYALGRESVDLLSVVLVDELTKIGAWARAETDAGRGDESLTVGQPIADLQAVDTSDIPEVGPEWFEKAKRSVPDAEAREFWVDVGGQSYGPYPTRAGALEYVDSLGAGFPADAAKIRGAA